MPTTSTFRCVRDRTTVIAQQHSSLTLIARLPTIEHPQQQEPPPHAKVGPEVGPRRHERDQAQGAPLAVGEPLQRTPPPLDAREPAVRGGRGRRVLDRPLRGERRRAHGRAQRGEWRVLGPERGAVLRAERRRCEHGHAGLGPVAIPRELRRRAARLEEEVDAEGEEGEEGQVGEDGGRVRCAGGGLGQAEEVEEEAVGGRGRGDVLATERVDDGVPRRSRRRAVRRPSSACRIVSRCKGWRAPNNRRRDLQS